MDRFQCAALSVAFRSFFDRHRKNRLPHRHRHRRRYRDGGRCAWTGGNESRRDNDDGDGDENENENENDDEHDDENDGENDAHDRREGAKDGRLRSALLGHGDPTHRMVRRRQPKTKRKR